MRKTIGYYTCLENYGISDHLVIIFQFKTGKVHKNWSPQSKYIPHTRDYIQLRSPPFLWGTNLDNVEATSIRLKVIIPNLKTTVYPLILLFYY